MLNDDPARHWCSRLDEQAQVLVAIRLLSQQIILELQVMFTYVASHY